MKITMDENDILEMVKSMYRFSDAKVKIEEGAVVIETNELLPKPTLPLPNYTRGPALPSDPTSVFMNNEHDAIRSLVENTRAKKSDIYANQKDISETSRFNNE